MKVLLTGATGFIGSELLFELLRSGDISQIVLIIRSSVNQTAQEKLDKIFGHWKKFSRICNPDDLKKIQIIEEDIVKLSIDSVPTDFDLIYHCAATTDLATSLAEGRKKNVYLTQKVVMIGRRCSRLQRFVHFSTAFVAGKATGLINPDVKPQRFRNHYERTKFESEHAVRDSGLKYTILRPSIVVGRSDTGYFYNLKVLYSVWKIWLKGVVPRAPLDKKARVDFVPVDYVVNSAIELANNDDAVGKVLFLCAGTQAPYSWEVADVAARVFSVEFPKTLPPIVVSFYKYWPLNKTISYFTRTALESLHTHVPYLGSRTQQFDTSLTAQLLSNTGVDAPVFSEYGERIFEFCKNTNWGKRGMRL